MKDDLINLFIDKLYYSLHSSNLSFNKREFANSHEFYLCSNEEQDCIVLDKAFLLDNLSEYFFNLIRKNSFILPNVLHDLLLEHPTLVFTKLSSLPICSTSFSSLDKNFVIFENIFFHDDLSTFLMNYKDNVLFSTNYYSFSDLLKVVHEKYHNHKDYHNILLHIFKIHKGLIRKKNGNIIGVRTWAIKNLNDIAFLEEFISIENENPLFTDIGFHTMLKFLDVKAVQARYLIKNAKGIADYHNLLKSLTSILNSNNAKTQLHIERVEGNFAFDKKKYQLTIFSKQVLDSTYIEKIIDILLKAICDYYNLDSNKPEDFESVVFKVFQYYNLSEKLLSKNKKTGKVQKI